jgi:hypothetical protein
MAGTGAEFQWMSLKQRRSSEIEEKSRKNHKRR